MSSDFGPKFWDGFDEKDGTININHSVFQLGRTLYDAQVVLADIDAGKAVESARVRELALTLCYLVNAVGQLRAEYASMRDQLKSTRS